ncbi:MAG: oxygenase MpaB family protein [Lacisediminihabitans sp.]
MPKRMRDIAGEAVLLAGGARAILLQIADPGVGEGVARHSDFASDPMRRLRNTLSYIYVVVYGTADDRARVVAMVNAAHRSVRGTVRLRVKNPRRDGTPLPGESAVNVEASVSGDRYDAADPQLQLWVAATLYDTAITVHESVFGTFAPVDADALYREYAVLGTALQVPPELWPEDRAAFRRYWDSQLARLRVTDDTRRVARELLDSHAIPWWLRLGMPLARLVTAGLLPPSLRVAFELPWDAARQRRHERAMRMIAAVYPRLPRRIRQWPMRHYVRLFHS